VPVGGDLLQVAATAFVDKSLKPGVAVSGGSDSMAVLHLMVQAGWNVRAVTVDHRLRAEAAKEAAFVAQVCAGLGVSHDILIWDHGKVRGNLMAAARDARYGLMADWARAQGMTHVVLGHTADDQAETFLMGLQRAAGLDGLSGMRLAWQHDGVTFARPFLHVTRVRLRDYLEKRHLGWVDDPTNEDEGYTRIKARKVLEALKPLGISADHLARVAENLAMAQSVVRIAVSAAVSGVVREVAGGLVMERQAFESLQCEVQRRILLAAFAWMTGAGHPPRGEAVDRVQTAIRASRDTTLAGCRIRATAATIRILREPRALAGLETPTTVAWDHRWRLDGPHGDGLTIRALSDGLRQVPDWRDTGLLRDALVVTPAVWAGDALIAAPLAGFGQGWTATVCPSFASFLLSH
jgi:tRNA(Ile)-lysidine synthase